MRHRRKSVRAGSIVQRIPRNWLHERDSYNQHTIHPDFFQGVADSAVELLRRHPERQGSEWPRKAKVASISALHLDPPVPSVTNKAAPAPEVSHLPDLPVPAGEAALSPPGARAGGRARAPRARKRNSKSGCAR